MTIFVSVEDRPGGNAFEVSIESAVATTRSGPTPELTVIHELALSQAVTRLAATKGRCPDLAHCNGPCVPQDCQFGSWQDCFVAYSTEMHQQGFRIILVCACFHKI